MEMTQQQHAVVNRLLAKGWIEPWQYRRSVFLSLPNAAAKRRRGVIFRDWSRPQIRVLPSGRILRGSQKA